MTAAPRTKTLADIQLVLGDQMDRLIAGETTPANVNAVVNATAAILRTVKMQMDYYRLIGKTPSIPLLLTAEFDRAADTK
jgi:hypothetical protein